VHTESDEKLEHSLRDTARRVLPAGGFGNLASDMVIREGRGGHVWDESGREYIDFLLGSGPMLVGHAHPHVTEAVLAQVSRGTTFFANNRQGIQLAEAIVDAVACAEKVRFVSSGTEADMYAMRLARAFRGRERILKFEGGFHGMSDHSLMSLAPKRLLDFPQAVPDSSGIPSRVRDEVLIAPFNDLEAVEALIHAHHDELACVIVEPLQRIIPPAPGFLEGLREITKRYGIVLIFDEIVTGFRFAYGSAQAYYGVTPDLCTLGKIIGGGFPLAAVAGRADIMSHFDRSIVGDDKFLLQIGTLSGNPVAAAAGNATLELLRSPGAYEKIFATGTTLMKALCSPRHLLKTIAACNVETRR
jgi:glutamate-1-semialdehyde 2,1-aminomutase